MLEQLNVQTDKEAEKILETFGLIVYAKKCPHCGCEELYEIRRNHYKCKSCKKEWSRFRGSPIEQFRIKPLKFLRVISSIAEGELLTNVAKEQDLSYNSVLKIRNVVKKNILKRFLDIDEEAKQYFVGIKRNQEKKFVCFKDFDLKEIVDKEIINLGRFYIVKNYKDYDLLLIVSDSYIPEIHSVSRKLSREIIRKDIEEIVQRIRSKMLKGKFVESSTLLYAFFESEILTNSGQTEMLNIVIDALKGVEA